MRFFRKKNKTNSIDKHGERFEFEYRVLPSVATFSPCQLFTIDANASRRTPSKYCFNAEKYGELKQKGFRLEF